jgi:AraC-like DNA-binding protein/quercetin dioxygenase-like cupin family protein
VLENLRLRKRYGGFVFLADAGKGVPWLATHHHAELELNIVARGRVTYIVGQHRYQFAQGELLWLFPGQPHRLVDRTPDALYYVAVFKQSLIRKTCLEKQNETLGKNRPPGKMMLHTPLEHHSFELARRMMDTLIAGAPDNDALNREAGFGLTPGFRYEHDDPDFLNAGLAHLLVFCWRNQIASQGARRPVPLHNSVLKALDILGQKEQPESLAALAKACGMSPSHLSRTFQKQVGVSLNRYRNTARLERFWQERNLPPQKTLIEAAFAAGFGSYAQFYKIFRTVYGQGPREGVRLPSRLPLPVTRKSE